ncbi:major facilitator superfamily domain-containing protein [Lophiotrema nucula]|uniref:Major facilitator superfamily domain-containing protein n=1 Tax=Lophiotrema nucula TaxID=690887 RepID=A0A6A5Z7G2_9PLEO|nr:major facilitator superfamily domain-containing protein [Lophiotrema nucula]
MLAIDNAELTVARQTDEQRETRITAIIDQHGFNVRVYLVAASGFFTDSYNLFATNVISPSLAYIYWNGETSTHNERDINVATLSGSLLGMLLFGHLCDRYGRQKLYGIELLIVIVATLGMAQASAGFQSSSGAHSMSLRSWIIFWRFVLGVGIGAEYPLSAVITAEWASKKSRARMLAAVFMMQPLGQLMAWLVGLGALKGISRSRGLSPDETSYDVAAPVIDSVWRCVIGVGAFPAFLAIVARLSIPETPRYTLLIQQNDAQAQKDAVRVYGSSSVGDTRAGPATAGGLKQAHVEVHNSGLGIDDVDGIAVVAGPSSAAVQPLRNTNDTTVVGPNNMPAAYDSTNGKSVLPKKKSKWRKRQRKDRKRIQQFTWPEIYHFFIDEGNWRLLAGTSLCWFILDVGFYGLGLNNPRTISKIWMSEPGKVTGSLPTWNSDFSDPDATIYKVLKQDIERSMITISIGSLIGSLVLLKLIKYVPRSTWLAWSFVVLAILFAVAGGSFFRAYQSGLHALTLALYIFSQLIFNLGPNTITFMIPAEVFPTRYRGTCHGIAAASGKLGSIVIQLILPVTHITRTGTEAAPFAYLLISFAVLMLFGALVAWAWIPDVQDARRGFAHAGHDGLEGASDDPKMRKSFSDRWEVPSKSLEVLGKGRVGVEISERPIGLRANLWRVYREAGEVVAVWRKEVRDMFAGRSS